MIREIRTSIRLLDIVNWTIDIATTLLISIWQLISLKDKDNSQNYKRIIFKYRSRK